MTRATHEASDQLQDKDAPEALELRSRPEPVTRINRRVLIAGAATLLMIVCGLVMIALRPPTLRVEAQRELVNVDNKQITDGLSRLPATYAGLPAPKPAQTIALPSGVPQLVADADAATTTEERVARDRLARMAGQAREAPVFFRLTLKEAPRDHSEINAATARGGRTLDGDLTRTVTLQTPAGVEGLAGDTDLAAASRDDQAHKLAVLNAPPDKEVYNPHALQRPISPYQLMAGTIIAASLVSGLNSDLPGFVIAHVTENVFDSISGRHLLVPQGSRLIGKYDSVVAFGQERALVVWQRIIRPDGSSVMIDNLPATDTGGYAGLADEVDLHTWKLLKGVALATVLGVGSELAFNTSDSDLVRALQVSTQSTTNRAGQRLVERQINVQPTITVRPGWPLRVIVHKDILLRPYEQPTDR